jgi:alginate O-acetyltransferase complex protein AlgI
MFFNSYLNFIYIILFVLIYNSFKYIIKSRLLNNLLLIGFNLLILLSIVKEHSLIVMGIISLVVFSAGRWLQKKNHISLLIAMLALVVGLFAVRNYPQVQEILSHSFLSFINAPILSVQKIGLSYILFRYIHWLVESYRKTIYQSDFATFLNYIFFFPSFLCGPIDQYTNFHYWLGSERVKYKTALLFAGISRIFIGALKTIGIVPLIIKYATNYKELVPYFSPLPALFISLIIYSVYIYLDFSGYSDIAIGTAYLIGIKSPENFNNPYTSHTISEFWRRWHITFSTFLRRYVFKPFIDLYNKLFTSKPKVLVSVLSYLSTFLICGLWHGSTINFVYWGLWHGIGLSVHKIWSLQTSYHFSNSISILLTFLFVSVGWLFFNYSTTQLTEVFYVIF